MTTTLKRLFASLLFLVGTAAQAAGVQLHMDEWEDRSTDLAALQNGARIFANYCVGCHGAASMRWNRLQDIGLDDKQIKDFLIFGNQKVGDTITSAMRPADAKGWFGKAPPDLSVIVRARTSFEYKGQDYLYTLLRGYYRDASAPAGWNNVAFPSIGMPHILWEKQGPREMTIDKVLHVDDGKGGSKAVREVSIYDVNGNATVTRTDLGGHPDATISYSAKPVDPALARQYDSDIADLVAFLTFMTEPVHTTRVRIGVWVLIFLAFFTFVAWRLNAVYWRDVR
jgi:ubiquinol-cytochrome c reductase cytochrome c1 subunit